MNKRYDLKSITLGATAALLALGAWGVAVSIPNTFTSGTTISSAQVNANFQALKTAVDAEENRSGRIGREGYHAYAWVPGVGTITPSDSGVGFYAANHSGNISVTSGGAGQYTVVFAGSHPAIRNVQVSAYGSGFSMCKVDSWSNDTVYVNCYNASGTLANSAFVINVMN